VWQILPISLHYLAQGEGVAFPTLDGEWKPAVSCIERPISKHLTGHIRIRNNSFPDSKHVGKR
jgi:hypothetical protein